MPEAMALDGMPSYSASSGSWAMVTPPASLIRRRPRVPSEPVPVSTMPMALPSWVSARVRKKWSMVARSRGRSSSSERRRWVSMVSMLALGGITYTWFGSSWVSAETCSTGMGQWGCRSRARWLSCSGERWITTTKGSPVSIGMLPKKVRRAPSPPAEAPMPTTMGRSAGSPLLLPPPWPEWRCFCRTTPDRLRCLPLLDFAFAFVSGRPPCPFRPPVALFFPRVPSSVLSGSSAPRLRSALIAGLPASDGMEAATPHRARRGHDRLPHPSARPRGGIAV